jgi:hypothetical protein
LRVLQTSGLVRFVSFSGRPAELDDLEPHPYLRVGQRVRVKYGPLAGAEGILVRKKDKCRLVLNLDLIMLGCRRSGCSRSGMSTNHCWSVVPW